MKKNQSSKILAVIPARGGSKGVPGKNIKLLAGKPLISYTLDHCLRSNFIDRTIVSTDNLKIEEVAKRHGAEVILRPAELAEDTTPSEQVIVHALRYLKEKENYVADIVVFLQCTSPLRREDDIDKQIKLLIENDYDSVFSVFEKHYFIWKYHKGDLISFNFDHKNRPRRQDREKEFIETGSTFVFKRDVFEKEKNRICGKVGIYILPYEYSFEIDTPFDFWLCEKIIEKGEH